MKFLKDGIARCSQLLKKTHTHHTKTPMDGIAPGTRVSNERIVFAYKLKGYFDLATEEIAKAVRTEEWGLIDDAIVHYINALRILIEASPTPSSIGFSEIDKQYRNGQVSERLQVLNQRAVSSSTSNSIQKLSQKSAHSTRNNPVIMNQSDKAITSKPMQDSGNGYEAKLIGMLNTAIKDRSPSVKWEDVAGLEKAKQSLMEMVVLPTRRSDLLTVLQKPARGLLLFGPPGNGKTMLTKAVASESEATFLKKERKCGEK